MDDNRVMVVGLDGGGKEKKTTQKRKIHETREGEGKCPVNAKKKYINANEF